MLSRPFPLVAGFLLLSVASGLPAAAQLVPLGPEVRVDAGSHNSICPSIAMEPEGGFTVAWSRFQVEGSFTCFPEGILQSRSFDRNGVPVGPLFPIARTDSACSFGVRLGPPSPSHGGGRIATWRQLNGKFGPLSVGAVEIGEGHQRSPQGEWIAPLRSGGFVAVSAQSINEGRVRLVADRFNGPGPGSVSFTIARVAERVYGLDIAEIADGGLVFVWFQQSSEGQALIAGRRFDAGGRPLGPVFVVAQAGFPTVASNEAGQFVVTWLAGRGGNDVMARIYGADGEPTGPAFLVSKRNLRYQIPGTPAIDDQGHVAVFWDRYQPPTQTRQIVGQLIDAAGKRLGAEILLTSRATGPAGCSSAATDGQGLWIVAWQGRGPRGEGIYVRRFSGQP